MIRVVPQPEPDQFDAQVRQPGRAAVAAGTKPLPDLWRRCLPELWKRYHGVCAYACFYIPRVTGGDSVEHFAPKSAHPELAYEWSNYRLVCSLMNSRKREFEDVLDPFEVADGWFELEFVTFHVKPTEGLHAELQTRVVDTIGRLSLNDDECRDARAEHYEDYQCGVPYHFLCKVSPFVAREIARQGRRRPNDD